METFSALLAICAGNSPVPGEFPAQRPLTRSFDFSLIYVWINGWVNNRKAGDLRRYRAHCGVTVMNGWHLAINYNACMINTYRKISTSQIHEHTYIIITQTFQGQDLGVKKELSCVCSCLHTKTFPHSRILQGNKVIDMNIVSFTTYIYTISKCR